MRHRPIFFEALSATALALFVALALGAPAWAVDQTGELRGVVRDETKAPFPGVLVTLTGENLQGERTMTTNASGEFVFRLLPPGIYTLKYSVEGYRKTEQDRILVNLARTTSLVVDMIKGDAAETVTVIGNAPLVDTQRTATQDNYTQEYLENVQVGSGGRDYLSVISNTAGTGPGDGANFTVRGATIGENVYLVDGVDSTDPVTATFGSNFIFDAIQEVQVQTGGFAAEFGRATGGLVNLVTKSGGNEFSGSVDIRFRNQDFIEKGDHFDPDDFSQKRQIWEGTFGGPIVKDRLWFFVAASFVGSDAQPSGSPSLRSFDGRYYLAKATWQLNPAHRLVFQVTGDPATIDNVDASVLVSKEANSQQTQGSRFATIRYEGDLTPRLILQAQAAYYYSQLDFEPQDKDFTTIGMINALTGEVFGNSTDVQYSDRFRNQANATLSWQVPNLKGEHLFKFGADAQKLAFKFRQFAPGGEFDDVAPDANNVLVPLDYNEVVSAGRLDNDGFIQGFFAQDEWRVHPRVTLNLGVRYDTFSYDDDRGARVIDAQLVQPRIGASWDINGNARNVVKAYGGVFAHPSLLALPRVVNTRANLTNFFVNEEIAGYFFGAGPTPVDLNGDSVIDNRLFFTSFGGPGGSEFAHNGHLDATNVRELAVSYERQLAPRSAVGVTVVQRKTSDVIEDELNASGVYIIDNYPELTRKHVGAELRYSAIYGNFHQWSSYSYGVSRGNIEYTQSLGADFDFNALRTNRYGYLSDDARHTLRTNGYWTLPLAFQIAYSYVFATGFPQTRTELAFPYGDKFIRPRGYLRAPSQSQLDLDARKAFNVGKGTLTGIATILNVLDKEIPTTFNSLDSELQAIDYQTPRRYEIGLKYSF